jgi:hypothetical protein
MDIEGLTYEERIISKINAVIFFVIAVVFAYLAMYSFSNLSLLSMTLIIIFLVIIVFIGINFSVMIIKIGAKYMVVSFGIFKKFFAWESIESCREDDRHAMKYGGWGVRFARIEGMPVMAYIVENTPRVVLVLKDHKYKEFVFSTKNPQDVLNIIRQKIEISG